MLSATYHPTDIFNLCSWNHKNKMCSKLSVHLIFLVQALSDQELQLHSLHLEQQQQQPARPPSHWPTPDWLCVKLLLKHLLLVFWTGQTAPSVGCQPEWSPAPATALISGAAAAAATAAPSTSQAAKETVWRVWSWSHQSQWQPGIHIVQGKDLVPNFQYAMFLSTSPQTTTSFLMSWEKWIWAVLFCKLPLSWIVRIQNNSDNSSNKILFFFFFSHLQRVFFPVCNLWVHSEEHSVVWHTIKSLLVRKQPGLRP